MNLLAKYIEMNAIHREMTGSPAFKILHDKKHNLFTVSYLHAGISFANRYARMARGLTLTPRGEIVIRGFEKFFNYNQLINYDIYSERFKNRRAYTNVDIDQPINIYEKLDGSMILLSHYKGNLIVSTTSSIDNLWANRSLNYFNELDNSDELFTFIQENNVTLAFEYISIYNRIVVEYDYTDHVLLAVIDNKTGKRWGYDKVVAVGERYNLSVVQQVETTLRQVYEEMKTRQNYEGYIYENEHGHLLKFKTDSWYEGKKILDIFFRNKLSKSLVNAIIDIYLKDEIDDALAAEASNPHAKAKGYVSYVYKEILDLQTRAEQLYHETKDMTNGEVSKQYTDIDKALIYALRNDGNINRLLNLPKIKIAIRNKWLEQN